MPRRTNGSPRNGTRGRFFDVVDRVNRLETRTRGGKQGRMADYLACLDVIVLDEPGDLHSPRNPASSLPRCTATSMQRETYESMGNASRIAAWDPAVFGIGPLERDLVFVTAMIARLEVMRQNRATMMRWAELIAVVLFVSMLPVFPGRPIALPC